MPQLNRRTLQDLSSAPKQAPGGFTVGVPNQPDFAILGLEQFQEMQQQAEPRKKINKILVTGGAGYIGSHTVRLLQQQGFEVVVYDNLSTGRAEAVQGCELVIADLADHVRLNKVFTDHKFDAVIHFAASIEVGESVQNPAKYFENNVVNSLKLLNAMIEHNVKNLVFSSTAAVYGNPEKSPVKETDACAPENPYGESKLMFEQILKRFHTAYGLNSVSLRYFNAGGAWPEEGLGYYNFETSTLLIPRVMAVASGIDPEITIFGKDYPTPDGTGIRDYVHVRDLADAHIKVFEKLETAGGAFVYNLGTGKGNSVLEVIDEAVEVTGRMIPINQAERRAGDPAAYFADGSLIKKELGWETQYNLADILKSAWAWQQRFV